MTALQRKLDVLLQMRQSHEHGIPEGYRPLFLRDVDRRINNIKRAIDELGVIPSPTTTKDSHGSNHQ